MGIIPLVAEPILDVFLFSVIIGFILTLFQKFLVNQSEAKRIKERMSSLSKEMKEKQNDRAEHGRIMSDYMKENSSLMRMVMKPSLVSLALFILIFIPALESSYGDSFTEIDNGTGTAVLKGSEYQVVYSGGKVSVAGVECSSICEAKIEYTNWEIRHEPAGSMLFVFPTPEKIVFSQIIARLPLPLPMAGEAMSWLGWYFLSLLLALGIFRKCMKIVI